MRFSGKCHLLLPLILLLFAPSTQADSLRVITSFTILQDLTREIAGDAAVVETLVGPDADAHVFEPSPRHARALQGADLVIINGLQFEGWMERLIAASGYTGPVIRATEGIAPLEMETQDHDQHHHHHDHGDVDPHAWHDVSLVRVYVRNISQALMQRDADNAELYAQRAAELDQRLEALDGWVRESLQQVEGARRVITSHDAFSYYGQAYGVEFLYPVGWSTDAEPSAATVGALIRQLREDNVRVLFVENVSDPRLLERIARDGGGVIGGVLYSDAL
ncbi:MAG: zinc ABC transporter substrate-binding protein, partial [Ectothiorhodospiraceae bacterium]|nr:zinc ABC transporter substrate-binding protein [Ectothiorhodospiraceae bacterium]